MSQTEPTADLAELRSAIDKIDREIVRAIVERAKLVHNIGTIKKQSEGAIFRPDREKRVYENVRNILREVSDGEVTLSNASIENIYREIISASIAIEGGVTVAYLGPQGTYSHMAVREKFGTSANSTPLPLIADVFREVESSGSGISYGVVPVDNTTQGTVDATLEMLLTSDLKIYAESYVRINHHLLVRDEIELKDIKKYYTIPIAKEQCRIWLQKNLNLRDVEYVETTSTASAARMVKEHGDGAAVASYLSAEMYDLKFLAKNIQDNANNMTRFFVVGKDQCAPTGDDKTSIVCAVKDRPGSLYKMLQPFYDNKINLTLIESRATRKSYGDYNFFIDFLGHSQDRKIKRILEKIASHTAFIKILGSYPRASFPDE